MVVQQVFPDDEHPGPLDGSVVGDLAKGIDPFAEGPNGSPDTLFQPCGDPFNHLGEDSVGFPAG
jgi:hypothetical protein